MRLPSLISRCERKTQSGDPFGVQKWCWLAGRNRSTTTRFPIATSVTIIGLMKRLYLGFDVSWAQIGAALDISRQSAWERFT
jgi:hypothetical protein